MFNINNNHNHRKTQSRFVLNAISTPLQRSFFFRFLFFFIGEYFYLSTEVREEKKRVPEILMHNKFKRIDGISRCCFTVLPNKNSSHEIKSKQNHAIDGGVHRLLLLISSVCGVMQAHRVPFLLLWLKYLWLFMITTLTIATIESMRTRSIIKNFSNTILPLEMFEPFRRRDSLQTRFYGVEIIGFLLPKNARYKKIFLFLWSTTLKLV